MITTHNFFINTMPKRCEHSLCAKVASFNVEGECIEASLRQG
jgi:hypothetical protein